MGLFNFIVTLASESSSAYPSLPSSEDFMNKIIPNVWAFLVQLLALIVLIVLFILLAYKPVKKKLEQRKAHIEGEILAAEEKNAVSSKLLKESEDTLIKTQKEATSIIEEAKLQAINESELVKKEAEKEIREKRQKAEEDIEEAKREASEDIRKEIINVSMLASKEVLGREISSKDNEKMVEDFIDEIKKEK